MNANRIRWGVRAVLTLGVAASITGNVLHAHDNFISRAISAWSPLALLMTIELIARVPVHRMALAAARWAATALIAGIAAWVSYWHMAAVAARYGETGASPYLLPLSVDGLVVVASICLVELSGRIRAAGKSTEGEGDVRQDREGGSEARQARREAPRPGEDGTGGDGQSAAGDPPREASEVAAEPTKLSPPVRVRKPHTTNPERVARAWQKTPDASPADIAKRLKLSRATVNRHRPVAEKINGHVPELQEVK